MFSTLKLGRFVIAFCAMLVCALPAQAQRGQTPAQPSGGLFGATRSDVARSDKLNFMVDLGEGWDSELPHDSGAVVPREVSTGGFSTLFEAASDYAHSGKRLRIAGTASTAFRYYQDIDRLDALSHAASLGATIKLAKAADLQINQSAAYSPSYLYQLFPTDRTETLGESIATNPDYQIVGTDSYVYATTVALSFGSAIGTRVTTTGRFSRTDFQNQSAAYSDLDSSQAGIKIAHHPSRRGGFSVAYDFRNDDYGTGGVTNEHRVTMGAEYSRSLYRTRRAIFRVEVAPSQLDLSQAQLIAIAPGEADAKLFRMSGEASVTYPFKPNWLTTARYRRSVEYLSVLGQPVLSDAARLEMTGLLARRVDLALSAGYATAASALTQRPEELQTYAAQVEIRYALKRSLALYSQYLYYYYDQTDRAQFAPGLPAVFEQHGVRIGVALFAETLGR